MHTEYSGHLGITEGRIFTAKVRKLLIPAYPVDL